MYSRKLTLAITSHGDRTQWIKRTLENVADDPRIEAIYIRDDGSEEIDFKKLESVVLEYSNNKINLLKSKKTGSSFYAKFQLMKLVRILGFDNNILLDSDNVIDRTYVSALWEQGELDPWTIYCPERAGQWSFENFLGVDLDKEIVSKILKSSLKNDMILFLNVQNYCLNSIVYGMIIKDIGFDPQAADGIYVNRILLQNGAHIKVVPGMTYEHTVHPGSTYLQKAAESKLISDDQVKKMEVW